MTRRNVSPSELKGKVDFGIITIREDEFEAVLQRFPTSYFSKGKQTYAISRFQTSVGDEYVVACVRCPEQGNGQGQTVAHNLIEELDPQWILVVGIAGSVPDNEHTLGDVVLATRLHDFSVSAQIEGRNQQTKIEFDTRGGAMHPEIQSLIAALPAITPFLNPWNGEEQLSVARPEVKFSAQNFYGDESWKKKTRNSLKSYFGDNPIRQKPKAFAGAVASSDMLVKNTQIVHQWLDSHRQIRGIEMELAGVYQAAWGTQKPVLAIRGISDIVGFKRSPEWTSYACHAAASFTAALLHYRPINPRSVIDSSAGVGGITNGAGGREKEKVSTSSSADPRASVFQVPPPRPSPLVKSERLYSNLLAVSYFPDKIYAVRTDCKNAGEVWGLLKNETDNPPGDWIYKGKTLYSFDDFSAPIWKNVCHTDTVEEHPTSYWADSQDQNRLAEFVELLRRCLREYAQTLDLRYIHKQKVNKKKKKFQYLYYAPTPNLTTRRVVEKSLVKSRPREVFKAYYSKTTGKFLYYRHHAFRFEFVKFDGQWYLEITPTYHYTRNGYWVSYFYEDLVKGIKRIEKNEAVFRQVLFWSAILQGEKSAFLEQKTYPFLKFGELLQYSFPYGVRDELWSQKESLGKGDSKKNAKRKPKRGGAKRNKQQPSANYSLFN